MDKKLIEKYISLALVELSKTPNGHEVWWPDIVEEINLPEEFSDNLKAIMESQAFIYTSTRTNTGDAVRATPRVISHLYDMEEKPSSFPITNLITTNGDGNVITTGSNNSVIVEIKIDKGNFNNLREYLKNNGVPEDDIVELSTFIDEDAPNEIERKPGIKVSNWLKKMIGKAIDGVWQVSIGAAGNLLAFGIQSYYGWKQ